MKKEPTQIEKLLDRPKVGITLGELKAELNALAQIRNKARVAFCNRLAIAYLMIVGQPFSPACRTGISRPFYAWCEANLRSGTGKAYSQDTLAGYLRVGFSNNPAATLRAEKERVAAFSSSMRKLGSSVVHAARTDTPPKPVSISRLRTEHKLPADVATEVNRLMTAWEQASPTARAQFIYMVTGKRLAA
jgi:hypothetical protein